VDVVDTWVACGEVRDEDSMVEALPYVVVEVLPCVMDDGNVGEVDT